MDMDIFFSDESKEIIPQESISIFTLLEPFFEVKSIALLCIFIPNICFCNQSIDCLETQEFSVPLITLENSKLDAAPRDKVKAIWQRVDDLACLQEGWDGPNSHRIHSEVIAEFKKVLNICTDSDVENISVFPQANGDLYLDYTKNENIAGITLTKDEVIFFKGTIDKLSKKGTFKFTPKELYNFISKLSIND